MVYAIYALTRKSPILLYQLLLVQDRWFCASNILQLSARSPILSYNYRFRNGYPDSLLYVYLLVIVFFTEKSVPQQIRSSFSMILINLLSGSNHGLCHSIHPSTAWLHITWTCTLTDANSSVSGFELARTAILQLPHWCDSKEGYSIHCKQYSLLS